MALMPYKLSIPRGQSFAECLWCWIAMIHEEHPWKTKLPSQWWENHCLGQNAKRAKIIREVDGPISLRLGFVVKLLGGPNGAFECESEGQWIPRKGTASSKVWGWEMPPRSGKFKVKAVVRDGSRKGLYVPHPPSLGSKTLQDPGIRAAGKGEMPRSFGQENGDETWASRCGVSHLQSPEWPWDPVSKQSRWTKRNRLRGD